MGKYFQILKITFEEYFVYRLNFLLWRFRSFVTFLALFFFWLAVYGTREQFLGYQKAQMLSYVVGIAFLRSIILGSRTVDLAGQIRTGELTKIILRPINIFKFWFLRDLADKILNLFFTIAEIGLILYIFRFPFYFPKSIFSYLVFGAILLLSLILCFYINFLISIIAFWTDQIWAPRWLIGVIFLEFLAGAFFPLDVLPAPFVQIAYLTPFPYLVFFPLKIWLEQVNVFFTLKTIILSGVWLFVMKKTVEYFWQKGIKNYSAYGG